MGTEFQEVLCDAHGTGGDGEYCGDNDAQLDRINVFYPGALGGKYIPRAVFVEERLQLLKHYKHRPHTRPKLHPADT
jgi:hypothetical protein